MAKKIVLISIAFIICILLFGQKGFAMFSNKFDWLIHVSGDVNYPMEVFHGHFIVEDGDKIYVPNGRVERDGWANSNSTYVPNDSIRPIPRKLYISWFSYTENKFYAGTFDLPFEQITKLFKDGFPVPGQSKNTYDGFMIGLAPRGVVSIWVTGMKKTEVGHFKAKETDIEWGEFTHVKHMTRDEYVSLIVKNELGRIPGRLFRPWRTPQDIAKNDIPPDLWRMYREKYEWKLEIIGAKKTEIGVIEYFNGEKDFTDNLLSSYELRVVPKHIHFSWESSTGKSYSSEIYFDENETFECFKKLNNPGEKITLQIKVFENLKTVVELKNSNNLFKVKGLEINDYGG